MYIVPNNKLMNWVGIIFLCASLSIAIAPQFSAIIIGYLLFFCLVIAVDAYLSKNKLDSVNVECQEVFRLPKGKERGMQLYIHIEEANLSKIKIGLPLDKSLKTKTREHTIKIEKGCKLISINWLIIGSQQGKFDISRCYLEAVSNIGFWYIRSSREVKLQIRVYPNLLAEQKGLSGLFMYKNLGIHSRRQIGKGREFEQLRDYIPGDCFEDIHWKATARRLRPITKMYQLEKTQRIYIIVDASRLSARKIESKSDDKNKGAIPTILEKYVSSALIMGLAAQRQGDHFGILTFQDKIKNFISAQSGKAHYNSVRDAIFTLKPKIVTPDFADLFTFIGTKIRRRSLLIFLTNLDDPVLSENFINNVEIISKKHLILVNMINPKISCPLFSDVNIKGVNDIYKSLAGHVIWNKLNETRKMLKSHKIEFALLNNERMPAQLVSQYIDIKKRQIL